MLLSDEVDQEYLKAHYPNATLNFHDIVDFFAKYNIHSAHDLLTIDIYDLSRRVKQFFRGSKYQRIRDILQANSLGDLNKYVEIFGRKPISQEEAHKIYDALITSFKKKDIFNLHDIYQKRVKDNVEPEET